jgi:SulP family sulfate permease
MALLRLGRFITVVPNVVISGFMNGIAVLIWIAQIKKLFGLGDTEPFDGVVFVNVLLVISTLVFLFTYPALVRKISFAPPGTLMVVVALGYLSYIFNLPVGMVTLSGDFGDFLSLPELVMAQWPSQWSMGLVLLALPYALQLSLLCYLDTLLTSLVVDRMTGEKTRQNKEIAAQGIANGTIALMGGIPGAQATIRSVLVVKEGGSKRIVGFFIGFFVLVEMALFQDLISFIPHAVFAGILIKAGYDVCDITTAHAYVRSVVSMLRGETKKVDVSHSEIALVAGTTLVTVLVDLNAAVVIFTGIFYLINRVLRPQDPICDLAYLKNTPIK